VAHGQRAVDRQHGQVGDVMCALDGTSTFADDTWSVMQVVNFAALLVHLVILVVPLTRLHVVRTTC